MKRRITASCVTSEQQSAGIMDRRCHTDKVGSMKSEIFELGAAAGGTEEVALGLAAATALAADMLLKVRIYEKSWKRR